MDLRYFYINLGYCIEYLHYYMYRQYSVSIHYTGYLDVPSP